MKRLKFMSQQQKIYIEEIGIMGRMLGALFYYPLLHENNQHVFNQLVQDEELTNGEYFTLYQTIQAEHGDVLNDDFISLFEGREVMHAPPWGSVYLDKEEVIFGDSTLRYRSFLVEQGITLDTGMREPEDQIGLILMAMSQLVENNKDIEEVKTLLREHLFPWCYRYFDLFEQHAESKSYQLLAQIARRWCQSLQQELDITAPKWPLYR